MTSGPCKLFSFCSVWTAPCLCSVPIAIFILCELLSLCVFCAKRSTYILCELLYFSLCSVPTPLSKFCVNCSLFLSLCTVSTAVYILYELVPTVLSLVCANCSVSVLCQQFCLCSEWTVLCQLFCLCSELLFVSVMCQLSLLCANFSVSFVC